MAVGDFIPKWYGTRSDIISYGGVDVSRYAAVAEQSPIWRLPLRVAYLGRFDADTGVRELINAAKTYYTGTGRKLDLHLFGSGNLHREIAARTAEDGMSLTINAPVTDTSIVLRDFPIVFASGYLSILESFCAGRIVFSYYNNLLREDYLRLHPTAGSMFVCGSADEVVRGISECVKDADAVESRCETAWRWARLQSWDALAARYIQLWDRTY
jgi:glycosyltransferase involved in cell wall biosynthesis